MYCLRCHNTGLPKKYTPGHFALELLLWLIFALPGLFYTLWRKIASYSGCSICGAKEIVPMDSPIAQKVLAA